MSETVISIENLSKSYRLGTIGTGTFCGDLKRWWAKRRGLPDPYSKIGETDHGNRTGETLWALKDINVSIQQGEAVGIIGRNGAGKSTLLKILSRVTAPTSGEVKVKGRIASLLEVGTGFHPELTGRENIFLNGAIMGMSRKEIERKFDEIVDFSGVEKFIDTPVKRYSSGMYVRLAFAVAAHLEPEILIVDEVLAVGDAEFQKKCLGKMDDVAKKQGRTVLFVSHSMPAIRRLCEKCMYLKDGKLYTMGATDPVIEQYQSAGELVFSGKISFSKSEDDVRFISATIFGNDAKPKAQLRSDEDIRVKVRYEVKKELEGVNIVANILSADNESVWGIGDWEEYPELLEKRQAGIWEGEWLFPANVLRPGIYNIHFGAGSQIKIYHSPDPFPIEILIDGAWRKAYQRFGLSGGPVAHHVEIKRPMLCG